MYFNIAILFREHKFLLWFLNNDGQIHNFPSLKLTIKSHKSMFSIYLNKLR